MGECTLVIANDILVTDKQSGCIRWEGRIHEMKKKLETAGMAVLCLLTGAELFLVLGKEKKAAVFYRILAAGVSAVIPGILFTLLCYSRYLRERIGKLENRNKVLKENN